MSRIFPLLIALVCLTPGCFGAHGVPDDPDDPDDPPRWTECYAALSSATEGDTCDFSDMCGESGCEDVPTRTVACIGGRVRLIERICSPVVWFDCAEFRDAGWGAAGDYCDPSSFGTCNEPLVDCCASSYRCEAGTIIVDGFCLDGCEELPNICDDYAPPPPEAELCTSDGDCTSGLCLPSGTSPGCGICFDPIEECMIDRDCGGAEVCVVEDMPCSCRGSSHVCRPACTTGSCDDGAACDDTGVCQPIDCTAGYECPANTRCVDPPSMSDPPGVRDAHSCERLACATDLDCDCGLCIEGVCQSGPGICLAPVPVAG